MPAAVSPDVALAVLPVVRQVRLDGGERTGVGPGGRGAVRANTEALPC